MEKPKCKLKDLIHDLVKIHGVTEIAMDTSGISLAIADSLRELGVKIRVREVKL